MFGPVLLLRCLYVSVPLTCMDDGQMIDAVVVEEERRVLAGL